VPITPRSLVVALVAVTLALGAACAKIARTSMEEHWSDSAQSGRKLGRVAIITVAEDEFAQQKFQEEMAKRLRARGVDAVATGRFFTHRSPAEEARFRRAVEDSRADTVMLARVIRADEKTIKTAGLITGPGGAPLAQGVGMYGMFAQTFAPANYVLPDYYTQVNVYTDTWLFDARSEKLLWSARTKTINADQGDLTPMVDQFVGVLVRQMADDRVI
jgi:hypothetical protein